MKTNNVPALVMLTAGFVDCVMAIRTGQELGPFVKQLLIILLIFYALGSIVKVILDRNFGEMDDLEEVDLGESVEQPESDDQTEEDKDEQSGEEQEETQQE